MKKALLTMIAAGFAASTFGQGYVVFENAANTSANITLYSANGPNAPAGSYQVALLWYDGTAFQQIAVYAPSARNGDGSGYFYGEVVAVPTYSATGTFMVQGWTGGYTNFAAAVAAGGTNLYGQTAPFLADEGTNLAGAKSICLNFVPPGHWDGNLVLAPLTLPVIGSQPTNTIGVLGGSTNLSVTASGPSSLSYQWQFNGTNVSTGTGSALSFTNLQSTNAGYYDIIVSDIYGSVTSSVVALVLGPLGTPSVYVNGTLSSVTATATGSASITLVSGFTNGFVFYTLDGSTPTNSSTLYNGPFTLTNTAVVQAIGYSSDFSQTALMEPVTVQIAPLYTVTTSVSGTGSVSRNPNTNAFFSNSVVTLTANPGQNWLFSGWQGDVVSTTNPLSVNVTSNLHITAVFVQPPLYTVSTSVSGSGSVGLSPNTNTFLSNSVVTLTATPAANWAFAQWQGDINSTANPLMVNVVTNLNIEAVFVPSAYPLTISTPGGGTVLADGAGASNTYFATNSVVSLTAAANSGWTFQGWNGGISGNANPYDLTITGPCRIQGLFGTVLNLNPVGGGQVVLSGANAFLYGASVTASAVPNNGNYFVAWSGTAGGTNSPVMATVTNAAINALFAALPANKLSLSVVANGGGQVNVNPQQSYYNYGDKVVLSSTPDYGQFFNGWSEGTVDPNSTTTVTMTTNLVVYANFSSVPSPVLGIAFSGQGPVLQVNGLTASKTVVIYTSPDLSSWQALYTNQVSQSSFQYTDTNAANASVRYYRASEQ